MIRGRMKANTFVQILKTHFLSLHGISFIKTGIGNFKIDSKTYDWAVLKHIYPIKQLNTLLPLNTAAF